MKQDETINDGLETMERVLGTAPENPPQPADNEPTTSDNGGEGKSSETGGPNHPPATPSAKKSAPVFVYLAVMFAAAFLMLLLAYFIQERNSAVQIGNLQSAMENIQSIDEMLEENQQLSTDLQNLRDDHASLAKEKSELEQQLTETIAQAGENMGTNDACLNIVLLENLMREERYEEAAETFTILLGSSETLVCYDIVDFQTDEMKNAGFSIRDRLLEIALQLEEHGYPFQVQQYQRLLERIDRDLSRSSANPEASQ